jgi:uncharacterized protein YkwD
VTTHKLLNRILPVAAISAGMLFAAPAADAAKRKATKKTVKATIALGDKRPAKARAVKARAAVAPCQNTDVMPTSQNVELIRAALLCMHNKIRADKNLPLLRDNARLRRAAAGHSADMVNMGYFDHTTLDGDTFVERILRAGYTKRNEGWTLGENLAWGTGDLSTPAGMMSAWMNSPGHRANILKRSYREVGIGVRLGVPSDDTVGATVTADFGVKL